MNVLKSISMATHSLPGSNGYKIVMRNQIRAIINGRGAPTLFVTINPSDVDNPIVRMFAGEEIDLNDIMRGEDMDAWSRKILAAKNPSACARFFELLPKYHKSGQKLKFFAFWLLLWQSLHYYK